jgi:hypothetical protein
MHGFVRYERHNDRNYCGTHQERSRAQTSRDVKSSHRSCAYRRRGEWLVARGLVMTVVMKVIPYERHILL